MEYFDPTTALHFFLTFTFSFIIGLELNKKKEKGEAGEVFFGTERTFAFIGMLAFILLEADGAFPPGYLVGWVTMSFLLGIFYLINILRNNHFGFTKVLVAELVYVFPLLLKTQPLWFALLIIVLLITLIEIKDQIKVFSQRIYSEEFLTLAKFIVITGVVLPLAPKEPITADLRVSFYDLWTAVVAVSALSYVSYLLQKYLFPKSGVLLSGMLGGLYSSTATTFMLSRRSQGEHTQSGAYAAGILLATVMMFLRVYALMWLFNDSLALATLPFFALMIVGSLLTAFLVYRYGGRNLAAEAPMGAASKQNPLEFNMALVFSALYVLFSLLTDYTIRRFGSGGLPVLSFIVGMADIDPFLINLFQNETKALSPGVIALSAWQAMTANNLLKMLYALVLSGTTTRRLLVFGFLPILVGCAGIVLFLWQTGG
jgi:uncharacterized membrane protein (DUF4010 family)